MTSLIGDKMTEKEIEKLTVKGIINIFKGIKPDKSILDDSGDLELEKLKFEFNLKKKNAIRIMNWLISRLILL